jgi:ribonuclease HI
MHDGYEYLGIATNNIAELTAILRAAELVPRGAAAVVHTDSQYSIGVLTKGWKAKANQELVANVKTALAGRTGFRLQYVPGHAGVPLNERADELAREAVTRRASKLPPAP